MSCECHRIFRTHSNCAARSDAAPSGLGSQSTVVCTLCRGIRGRRVKTVPASDSDSTDRHPSMLRSPPGFPAKPAVAAEAANLVGGGTAKAAGNTVPDVTARSGAMRTWAGSAAGPLSASRAVGVLAEAGTAGSHPGRGTGNPAAGEEDADFDDLLAGLTGGAALEGEILGAIAQQAFTGTRGRADWGVQDFICAGCGGRERGHALERGLCPQPLERFLRVSSGCQDGRCYVGPGPAC